MPVLLTYVCICEHAWVREHKELTVGRCGVCNHFPVFPSADEEIGEVQDESMDTTDAADAEDPHPD